MVAASNPVSNESPANEAQLLLFIASPVQLKNDPLFFYFETPDVERDTTDETHDL
jgi:hypothetical protein